MLYRDEVQPRCLNVEVRSHTDRSMCIQTSAESNPSTPSWFGEVVLISRFLRKHDVLTRISERMRFAHPGKN
jgi:hypothetical protein